MGLSILLMNRLGFSVSGWMDDHKNKLPFSSHHIKDRNDHRELSLLLLTLISQWTVFLRFQHREFLE